MKYLSVCSGIEAASVAWHPLGWEPLAFSEIEAFPRAVLQHHYPDVPLYGDFTKLRDEPFIVDADILVGGTPCQAFSVAGLRNSLSDERGNLSLEFVRLADAIDAVRSGAGREPSVIVWENVPGVLSVKDNAFGSLLAGLAGEDVPLEPPGGKWKDAGCVIGPQRTIAWRTLDAQFFGLAQRRKRVFVVASAGDGFDPAAVLLEFEGVRRDSAPRRETGQAASPGPSGCAGERSHWDGVEHPHPTLNQSAKGSGGVGASNQEIFSQRGAYLVPSTGDVSHCLNAGGMGRQDYETETLVTHALRGEGFDATTQFGDIAGSLTARHDSSPCADRGMNVVAHTLRTQCGCATEGGRGSPLVPVLSNDPAHAICANEQRTYTNEGSVFQLRNVVAQPVAFSYKDSGNDATVECSPTLRSLGAYDANGGGQMAVAVQASQSGVRINDTIGTLDANYGSRRHNGVMTHMQVRRLTPVECERLQGFPDGYTLIPWKKKPAEDCPDGPRYKALGNSMAVPCMRWIGARIKQHLGGEA